jgi:hypothetical protein
MTAPPNLDRVRQLLGNDVSLERAWHELNSLRDRAAASTVEALMFVLRERGIAALTEPKIQGWLAELGDEQVVEVGARLQKLKPQIARAWSAEEVETLIQCHEELR